MNSHWNEQDDENWDGAGHETWEVDEDDDEDYDTVECPSCSASVYEDAEQCPVCGEYIHSASLRSLKPKWFVGIAIVLVVAMLWAYIWPLFVSLFG